MKKIALILFLALPLLILASCSSLTSQSDNSYTIQDSGTTCHTVEGETFDVKLKANPTTGYTWNMVDFDKNILHLENYQYVTDNLYLTGSGGNATYTFKVVGFGTTQLVMNYNRVWEKDVPPAETFKLNIDAKSKFD